MKRALYFTKNIIAWSNILFNFDSRWHWQWSKMMSITIDYSMSESTNRFGRSVLAVRFGVSPSPLFPRPAIINTHNR
jgi:hypothetical protein